jgi:hypothetical protein
MVLLGTPDLRLKAEASKGSSRLRGLESRKLKAVLGYRIDESA